MSPVIIFRLNTLKGTTKAPAVDLLRLYTLTGTKTALLSPKSYDEHPRPFIWESRPSQGRPPCHSNSCNFKFNLKYVIYSSNNKLLIENCFLRSCMAPWYAVSSEIINSRWKSNLHTGYAVRVPWVPEVLFFFREERPVKTEKRKIRTSGHGGLESHFHENRGIRGFNSKISKNPEFAVYCTVQTSKYSLEFTALFP